jgi:hypothetical protein
MKHAGRLSCGQLDEKPLKYKTAKGFNHLEKFI